MSLGKTIIYADDWNEMDFAARCLKRFHEGGNRGICGFFNTQDRLQASISKRNQTTTVRIYKFNELENKK